MIQGRLCASCVRFLIQGEEKMKKLSTQPILKKHLQSKHKQELEKEELVMTEEHKHLKNKRKFEESQPGKYHTTSDSRNTSGSQISLEQTLELKKIWDINSAQAQPIHYATEMIAVDCQPYFIVKDIGFSRLMKKMRPNYQLPSRKYFSETIVPSIYRSVYEKVMAAVEEAEHISFTTDIWTSNSDTSFISLTAHCLNTEFEQKNTVLRVKPFPGSHTAAQISTFLVDTLQEFKIPDYKVHLIVRDNGANIVKGIEETGYQSLSCFLHTLQLVIHDCIFEQRIVKDIIAQCKQIVGHFNHSPLAYSKLAKLQKDHRLPEHKLVQDVPTRWNSTYFMLERISEQKTAIANYTLETPNLPVFDANKWNIIRKLSALLKVFHKTTVTLSERSSTASNIIPQIKFLMFFLSKASTDAQFSGLGSMLTALKLSATSRFSKYLNDSNMILGTFLDPRYKDTLFTKTDDETSETALVNIKKRLLENYEKQQQVQQEIHNEEEVSFSITREPYGQDAEAGEKNLEKSSKQEDDIRDFDFDKCYDELIQSNNDGNSTSHQPSEMCAGQRDSSQSLSAAIGSEVERFMSMKIQSREENPLQWWKENKHVFSYLPTLTTKYLSAPPSSIESERLFSIGGNVYIYTSQESS